MAQSKEKELTFDLLLDWMEGRLSPEEAATIARRVRSADRETKNVISWLQMFERIADDVVLASPPDTVRETLLARFSERSAGRGQPAISTTGQGEPG